MYKPTIGLEIHAELKTSSKMFCSCKNDPEEKRPNANICEVCTAQPGTLPTANEDAVKKVIKAGLALNCNIATESKFDRKNYFYPDIPKGYQISQYDQPLCEGGFLMIGGKKIGITRIHLEEDTGSSVHPDGADYSLVNFNRAGVPLMELVTEPDISSAQEAADFAKELQLILKYLGVSDADMEKGLMRVEVNISLSKTEKFGTKVEIKNLNSFKVVQKAIDFEIQRQTEVLEAGEKVVQETRGWHDKKEITFSQREKESAHDYRYFPEPDLLPMHFSAEYIDAIKSTIPELPAQKRVRFADEYGLDEKAIEVFIGNKDLSEYYEKVVSEFAEWTGEEGKKLNKLVANYLISDVQGLLQGKEFVEKNFKITPEDFAEFIKMIYKNEISSKVAKMVLPEMFNTGIDPSNIVESNNWGQMKDDGELEKIITEVIEKNPKPVADYKAGNKNAIQFLSGQVMAVTRGTADPKKIREMLEKILS
jgi:aspartyl-tRNA(Asn)/glutamyl-tRNA(Gln) amidotransferase subunit B